MMKKFMLYYIIPLAFSLKLMNLMDEIRKQVGVKYEWD